MQFGENPSTCSEDNARERNYPDANEIRTNNMLSPLPSVGGHNLLNRTVSRELTKNCVCSSLKYLTF